MSQQTAKRRRTQARKGYAHIDPLRRPRYKRSAEHNIHAAIERERRKAARIAAAGRKK